MLQLFDDKTVSLSYFVLLHCSAQLARSCSDCGVVYRDRSVVTIILANGISWSRRWALCRTRVIIRSLIGYCNSPAVSIFGTPFIPELTRKYFNKIYTLWIRIFYIRPPLKESKGVCKCIPLDTPFYYKYTSMTKIFESSSSKQKGHFTCSNHMQQLSWNLYSNSVWLLLTLYSANTTYIVTF